LFLIGKSGFYSIIQDHTDKISKIDLNFKKLAQILAEGPASVDIILPENIGELKDLVTGLKDHKPLLQESTKILQEFLCKTGTSRCSTPDPQEIVSKSTAVQPLKISSRRSSKSKGTQPKKPTAPTKTNYLYGRENSFYNSVCASPMNQNFSDKSGEYFNNLRYSAAGPNLRRKHSRYNSYNQLILTHSNSNLDLLKNPQNQPNPNTNPMRSIPPPRPQKERFLTQPDSDLLEAQNTLTEETEHETLTADLWTPNETQDVRESQGFLEKIMNESKMVQKAIKGKAILEETFEKDKQRLESEYSDYKKILNGKSFFFYNFFWD
jgi:hypothetical protein